MFPLVCRLIIISLVIWPNIAIIAYLSGQPQCESELSMKECNKLTEPYFYSPVPLHQGDLQWSSKPLDLRVSCGCHMSYIYSPTVHVAEPQSCSLKRHPLLILIDLIDKWANGDRLRSYQPCPSLSALCIHLLLETTHSLSRSLLLMYLYKLLSNNTVVKSVDRGFGLRRRARSVLDSTWNIVTMVFP